MSEAGTIVSRNMGGIVANVTVQERHTDELTITKHPVEIGAAITDHAYKEPARLQVSAGWSNSSDAGAGAETYVEETYQQLLALQLSRQPFQVVTGKRTYDNMLFRSLGVTTDEKTEHALMLLAELDEIILVTTVTTAATPTAASSQASNQKQPADTGPTQQEGTVRVTGSPFYNNGAGTSAGILDTQGQFTPTSDSVANVF